MANVNAPKSKPEEVKKPAPQDFKKPVAWLFGRQYIASLKWILLYAAFKGKLDSRDWMKADIIPDETSAREVDKFWRQWNTKWAEADDGNPQSDKEFWFDYISDTGDGQRAVYSIAYLCMSDLAVSRDPEINEPAGFVSQPDAKKLESEGKMLLPRGTFLFVGGDTSYHISDYGTLATRFQNPFRWAAEDLEKEMGSQSVTSKPLHPLLGIPGNHDYYDSLDGFNRQFRRPCNREETETAEDLDQARRPLLAIPTFGRYQESSYLALRLPFDWWFWGLDTEDGEIDFRQREFFRAIQDTYNPRKLVIATPEPTTVFGRFATEDENQSKTFAALRLERPYLKKTEPLGEGKCRLDLSGDIHHYARYWGPAPSTATASNYASVVSGGGGAFFHPSQTDVKEVPAQVLYPQPSVSRSAVSRELFKFQNIVKGGQVWLFGLLIAFGLFFAASFPKSTKDAVDSFPPWVKLGISPPSESQAPLLDGTYVKPMYRYTWGPNAPPKPQAFFFWIISLAISIVVLGSALAYSKKIFKKDYDPEWRTCGKEVELSRRLTVWALILVAFAFLAYGLYGFFTYEPYLTRYARSLIILAALLWAVLAIIESLVYSQWLFEEAYRVNIRTSQYWPIWALMVLAALGFGASVWFFGRHEAAFLISDLIQLFILLAVGLGLIYFAYGTGGKLKSGKGKIGFLLLGASHGLLQLAVPFLLVRKGHLLWAPLAAVLIVLVFKLVGMRVARLENGFPLALTWLLFGAALIVVPFILHSTTTVSSVYLNMPDDPWIRLLLCVYAGAIGAIMSCVLFGGYLAVALAFNGHNNEAGGAARIEGFKQFIRFRVNRQGLTGYVIAIDEPETEGSKLKPKVIDVFRIRA